jgi:uncharacterized phage protein (TIGR01671 family)
MSRTIKFKVWRPIVNDMTKAFDICDFGEMQEIFWREAGENILRQYTGLNDKNGIEIYEGDILSVNYRSYRDDEEKIINLPVIFCDGNFGLGVSLALDEYPGHISTDITDSELIEVIGNIYENPEIIPSGLEIG